ncbi:MAG TPA: hypothetical protein VJV05_09545 [Pyrinomonadaceae bacterium]|nr:hypothetical protein [Pyrinomonadaceae bacterium]
MRVGYLLILLLLVVPATAQNNFTGANKTIVTGFQKHVDDYIALRERLEKQLPEMPKKATPEQIEVHKAALLKSVQAQRVGAKHGDIFTPEASTLVRQIIKEDFKGRERAELRRDVFEAETKGVVVKVNAAYPESKELMEMSPSLLLALPQLPKQIRYRFVGTNLLLVDRENNLILDYMTNALP